MSRESAEMVATPSTDDNHVRPSLSPGCEVVYKYIDFGFRKLGDPVIDFQSDSQKWSTAQDVELVVRFQADSGQRITSAVIKIDQSSHKYEAHIIGGGIGQDNIQILIKAQNIYWFNYESRIYGEQSQQLELECEEQDEENV